MLPRLPIIIAVCLSSAAVQAEEAGDPAAAVSGSDTAVSSDQVAQEKQEARRQVISEGEDPQDEKSVDRHESAEQAVEQARQPARVSAVEEEIEKAREEVRSEAEEPRIEREEIVEKTVAEQPYTGKIYGSVRLRYRSTDAGSVLGDAGSRVGLEGEYRIDQQSWVFARLEVGFNLLDELDTLLSPGGSGGESEQGDSLFPRLYTVGIDTPVILASYGKSWSTYYKIAGFTDRFDSAGGSAVGTFNANTDGGATGTGRADNVLQTLAFIDFLPEKWRVNPFNLNIQLQSGSLYPASKAWTIDMRSD